MSGRRIPRRGEDKGSFRLTARPQDGPKASRLPSLGREIFSLHLSPPSATPPMYESGYTSSVGGAVAFLISGYDFLPLAISFTLVVTVTVTAFTLQARVPLRAVRDRDEGAATARFSTPEI